MSDLLWQGLEISGMGMGLTFAALGLLILTMILLERLFRVRPSPSAKLALEEEPAVTTPAQSTGDEEIVAAIATAMTYLQAQDTGQDALGDRLEAGHGAWWKMSRWQGRPYLHPTERNGETKHESRSTSKGNN